MITLFIDTSNEDVSIAIIKNNIVLSKICKSIPNEHSIYTVDFIDKVLKSSDLNPEDIDNIMLVNGPGSFTGIRIGLTIAKTYAYLLKKDLILLSSLKIMALSIKNDYILSVIDAKHDNYYYGLYDKDYNEIVEEQFNNIDELNKIIKEYPNIKIVSNKEINNINNDIIKELDFVSIVNYYKDNIVNNIHLVTPNYLKLPEAMEK